MEKTIESTVMSDLLAPVTDCFTSPVAQRVAALKLDPKIQARIDDLAGRCNEGALTDSERAEYEAYVEALDTVAILQAKARLRVSQAGS